MSNLPENTIHNTFEENKQVDVNGTEYWYSRKLSKILNYAEFHNFVPVIEKAKIACNNSQQKIEDHFVQVHEMVGVNL